jgi:hypothetical protein
MDKMNIIPAKPLFHLSTFIMEKSEDNKFEDDFDENIQKYIEQIPRSANRSQAIQLRTNALKFIDQWRLERFQQVDQRVRTAGKLILNAFDEYQSRIYLTNSFELIDIDYFRSTTTG